MTSLSVRGMALQTRDRILVAGERCIPPESVKSEMAFALARYRPDGSLDRRFGNKGTAVNLAEGQHAVPRDLVLQSNDRVLVVGNTVCEERSLRGKGPCYRPIHCSLNPPTRHPLRRSPTSFRGQAVSLGEDSGYSETGARDRADQGRCADG